ncbi:10700_t:CDS:2, partial [Racocetra persica]
LAEKLDQAETQLQQSGRVSSFPGGMGGSRSSVTSSQSVGGSSAGGATATAPPPEKKRVEESPLTAHGLISQVLKNVLFNKPQPLVEQNKTEVEILPDA